MKKKLFKVMAFMLVVVSALSMFTACSPDNSNDDKPQQPVKELAYELNSDGQSYKVMGFKEEGFGDVTIPDTYEGKPVTIIAQNAFVKNATKVRNVVVGKNVEVIETNAFKGCQNLESFKFVEGSKIKTIKTMAIESGPDFPNVIIPASIEVIETEAFFGCDSVVMFLEVESAPAGFQENWDLIDFDTYGQKTVKAVVCFKGEWSLVNGNPVKNA